MNPTDFRKGKRPIWRENKWNYFISLFAILVGILFQYWIFGTDWPESKNNGEIPGGLTDLQFGSILFIFCIVGLYGFWRIPAGYNFIKLTSNLPIEDKKVIVKRAFERMGKDAPDMTGDSMTFHYKGFLWSSFDVTILLDLDNFYINAQSWEDYDGGFIDLGSSYRLMKRIRRNIRSSLVITIYNGRLKKEMM